ncbi:programmed cell death protein 7-like [Topomyia yanbarensis]|uniref:programmed cell death protein 7-like n=1 Tax=Topomyia yanbarensis TaxID=2498891 RepID=UPI00273CE3D9|nr:programmed cell death protein 7-like [Topomyia yanbarensis]
MFGLPFFDPTRPPPPAPAKSEVDYLIDQKFVQTFLTNKHQIKQKRRPSASISELKTKITSLVSENENLKIEKERLENEMNSLPEMEWNAAVDRMQHIQKSVEKIAQELDDSKMLEQFKQKLHARRKKRAWEKRRNARLKQQKQEQLANRKQLHERIAEWQQDQRALLDEEKLAQQQLDYAGNFLADVHRRKGACKRHLAKFDKMIKQRHSEGLSNVKDDSDKKFEAELSELTKIWNAKLADCIKEEKRLKDVLARRSAANFQRRVENEWNRTLLGDTIPKKFEHPLLEADRDRDALIRTRWAWDVCLVGDADEDSDDASSIPLGWVLPPLDPAPEWAEYRAKESI